MRVFKLVGGIAGIACAVTVVVLVAQGSAAAKKPKAELVVTKVGSPPATLPEGTSLTVSDKVKNRRSKAKRSENAYLLSFDKFRDRADVELIGSRKVPKLKRGKSSKGTAELTVPSRVPRGEYRLLVCADATERVRERSESNNCKASRGKATVPNNPPPDNPPPDNPPPDDPYEENPKGSNADAG